jgi:hypothetical protein
MYEVNGCGILYAHLVTLPHFNRSNPFDVRTKILGVTEGPT